MIFIFLLLIIVLLLNNREQFANIPAIIRKRFKDSDQNTAIYNINKDIIRRQSMLK
jgi:hypothetical protein